MIIVQIFYSVFTDILFGVSLYSAFEWLLLVREPYKIYIIIIIINIIITSNLNLVLNHYTPYIWILMFTNGK